MMQKCPFPAWILRRLPWLLLLQAAACARAPVPTEKVETAKEVELVSAASFLGDQLVVDVATRSLFAGKVGTVDIASWKIDEAFQQYLQKGAEERGKTFRALQLDLAEAKRKLHLRESRWQKTVGRYKQAFMDFIFREAETQGIRFLFLALPLESMERFPSHRGPFGVFCNDRKDKDARAYVYFEMDFSLWDVPARKKVFQVNVDPSVTAPLPFATCATIAQEAEPAVRLQDPAKKTLGLLTEGIFEKLGWKRSYLR